MIKSTIVSRFLAVMLWVPVAFFSLLLSHNAMLYFTHGGEYGILPEKLVARQDPLWNMAFYIHLPAGVICLLTPFFLFAKGYLRRFHRLHEALGKMYVWITLLIVCPTGMYLALYAKGGLVTQTGFMVQGILLGFFTYRGFQAALQKNKQEHIAGMVRSYAIAAVVLTFRVLHILFFILEVPYQDNYAISQWLGMSFNMLLAEIIIARLNLNQKTVSLKSHAYEIS